SAGDRSRFSLRLLFGDPLRKLASIALAIVLWHLLDNQITKTATLDLQLETVSSASHPGKKNRLLVTIDAEQYFVEGFYDRRSGQRIERVRLELVGANILVDTLSENPGFRVTPEIEASGEDKVSVEFTIADVRPIEPKFAPLFEGASLTPSSIRVDLIRNSDLELALDPEHVQINASPQTERRLQKDSAEFTPRSVILLGPANQIELLQAMTPSFYVDIPDPQPSDTSVQGTLQIIEDPGLSKLRFQGKNPIIKIPLSVKFETVVVRVPYELDRKALPKEIRHQYTATEEEADIEIEIGNRLALTFWNMNESDRQAWFRTHARLWVLVTEDQEAETDSYTPEFIIVGQEFREGIDYRARDLPPLTVKRTQ
ncbi:MAG: hypothetical protein KDB80_04205, partial [Planctomycetes bacterium]|nr:hypothetical protein [Planctomycetota bacterium]